ncbi:MAG: GMC family oxidoreductase N-terminal domain-containing protein, partial [Elusimicrobia bacterium]|nr:GMC family oxidoreductase N-terminal domain-containing protein [Elusimicrobiota bacterium]
MSASAEGRPPERADCVVVGSGPGGAVAAWTLQDAGLETVVLEEGAELPLEATRPFSSDEMRRKYRCGGVFPFYSSFRVAAVEGRVVGGGSEVNSALYHRAPAAVLEEWRAARGRDLPGEAQLRPFFEACEQAVGLASLPGPASRASLALLEGARRTGADCRETPRLYSYSGGSGPGGVPRGERRSMSRTLLPRFRAAGGRLFAGCRVTRLERLAGGWRVHGRGGSGGDFAVDARRVVLAGGAVQTPALLLRSGIGPAEGFPLRCHLLVKAAAQFPDEVNFEGMGVPVHQVLDAAGGVAMGCSVSSPAHLALTLVDHPDALGRLERDWRRMAVYYATLTPERPASVTLWPGLRDPVVRLPLGRGDAEGLARGLRGLA